MKHSSTLYVGLDVHKESIAVAYVSDAKDAEVLYLGSSGPASPTSISSSAGVHSKNTQLVFVYEVPRYPRLPVTSCAGYEPSSGDSREGTP